MFIPFTRVGRRAANSVLSTMPLAAAHVGLGQHARKPMPSRAVDLNIRLITARNAVWGLL